MSNSSLVTYTKLSPNNSGHRNHDIDTVTIHCMVAQWTAKQACDYFANSSVQASCNYAVGRDGSIGLCVEEKNRSWCSSSRYNDNRAITIEVASDTTHPYKVTDAAYKALINLLVDICKRNNIPKLLWEGNKRLIGHPDLQNMTVHRWFANKACPGDYLYNKHPQIAAEVNARLNGSNPNEGWKKDNKGWYFIKNGKKEINAWEKDSGGWCYLGADGYLLINGWAKDSTAWYYMGADGHMVKNNWQKDSGGWCYLDTNGMMMTNGWAKDSHGWAFMDHTGHMMKNNFAYDGAKRYHLNAQGYRE